MGGGGDRVERRQSLLRVGLVGWLGGSLSLGESDGLGARADITVCETAERLASCTVHVCFCLGCVSK